MDEHQQTGDAQLARHVELRLTPHLPFPARVPFEDAPPSVLLAQIVELRRPSRSGTSTAPRFS